jgi:hypothetical protein
MRSRYLRERNEEERGICSGLTRGVFIGTGALEGVVVWEQGELERERESGSRKFLIIQIKRLCLITAPSTPPLPTRRTPPVCRP